MKPIILINFKTYKEATGKKALHLAKIIQKIAKKNTKARFMIAVEAVDIEEITEHTSLMIIAQHAEALGFGKHTGHVILEAVKEAGASGTLINHSEFPLKLDEIKKVVKKNKSLKLLSVVCANNINIAKKIDKFSPDYIAVEPPELIGGKISVAEAKPGVIKNAVKSIKSKVLVGAGINKAEDLRVSLKLGAKGILLSSAIVTAKNPEKVLKDLLRGLE